MRPHGATKIESWLFEIARVLVRFDHVARFIVNADDCTEARKSSFVA